MSTVTPVDGAIVVGVDGSESATRAVRWAAKLAASRGIALHLVHGFGVVAGRADAEPSPDSFLGSMKRQGFSLLTEAEKVVTDAHDDLVATTSLRNEPPITVLKKLSRSAHMIVLGSSGLGGFEGMLLGSTAVAVVSYARCPVVVVRGREEIPADSPVVVGIDGSPVTERAIAAAFDEAARLEVGLVAVHAWSDTSYDSVFGTSPLFIYTDSPADNERQVLTESLAG
ncbi:nucleotide-binding universal stress UspA family protein [Tamaricihabitans halophyticus]|uniref:Nucleotide-binding universal stress UspA family protein n=1 Tax=Tamaricihabitans halophyticus TaxID=1262583 RepID=A0A4R2Q282_9PSEU|nr:nucleotide-binding universal stress UspA family protein [Tamaricihabitans halophyticus]